MKKLEYATAAAQSAIDLTREITTRWNSRLAGSEACRECGTFLEEKISAFCEKTTLQEFSVRPGAFLGYLRINVAVYGIALLALLFQQVTVAALLASLTMLITLLEFFFYKEFVDFLYPAKTGQNVFGSIAPSGEEKQQIIISAHHDSAHIFNFLEKDPSSYKRKVLSATFFQFALFVFTALLWILQVASIPSTILYWAILALLIIGTSSMYQMWFFYDTKNGTPGAGDNMACVAVAIEIGKYFAQQKASGNPLKNTKLVIASWDAEECGLRGARAFVKKHTPDLLKTKTYNFNLECLYDHKELAFLVSDLNNFVSLSENMAKEGTEISAQLGYQAKTRAFPLLAGSTDAAEFAKAGVEATTLIAMNFEDFEKNSAYHTTRDTTESLDEEAVRRSIEIGIQYVLAKDKAI